MSSNYIVPTATAVQDRYLPAIFKRRQRLSTGFNDPKDPQGDVRVMRSPLVAQDLIRTPDGQVSVSDQPDNILAPPPVAPITIVPSKPTLAQKYEAAAEPVDSVPPTPMSVPAPNVLAPVSPSGQIMDGNATRARRVETDKRGRPIPNITMQGDQQTLDYNDRLARMPPDKAGGGWWPKIAAAIAGFAAGGPVGAAAAFGTRALREHFDPELGSREYKARKSAEIAPAVASIQDAQKEKLDTESKTAATDLAKARTDALKNPKTKATDKRIIERKDGVYAIDPVTLKSEKISDIPAEAGTPGSTRYISRSDGVWGINAEHPNGFKVSGIPGTPGKAEADVSFSNAQIQQGIKEAEASMAKIDAGLQGVPRMIEGTDPISGVKKMVSNPDYTFNMAERRRLERDIRNLRIKLKSPKKAASTDNSDPLGILDEQ